MANSSKVTTAASKKTAAKTTRKSSAKKVSTNLLILESPSKAKTVQKYLGSSYTVVSSKGHIRDLPASELGVDVENGFAPKYVVSRKEGKTQTLKELKEAAKQSRNIYLATDPDREGEAIAWHLADLLGIDKEAPVRVTFNEITKNAVKTAIKAPRAIDKQLFYAQQTRRVLDRIVGYKISPFLWHKIKKGLSAGRVQSVATKLIVDREREIKAFVPAEYWTLDALFSGDNKDFSARFYGKSDKMTIKDEASLKEILKDLDGAEYRVAQVRRQEKQKSPRPPFTTSSLQQDASTILNMRPQVTMNVAQSLYEGVEIKGKGLTGLITYMRTDSLRVSEEAVSAAAGYIKEHFGEEYAPKTPHVYKTKKNAQDAHEAIRPSDVTIFPNDIKDSLTNDQYKLYKLIWARFMASQMSNAVYDTLSVDIEANGYIFKANDSVLRFKGFTVLYAAQEDADDLSASKLPANLEQGMVLPFSELKYEQKFTQPPSRYTEASLVKTFEESGIGRPSTYATIVSTIQERGYISREGKMLVPTELGFVTNDMMVENFPDIVDVNFTAGMEEQLDYVAEGKMTYEQVMTDFYKDFVKELETAEKNSRQISVKTEPEVSDVKCELCGSMMVYKVSRFGRFLACPNYPTCKNTKAVLNVAPGTCPNCGKKMIIRKSRTGKTFYACEDYAGCKFMTWDIPVADKCPKCGKTLFKKFSKLICLSEGCGFEKAAPAKKTKSETEDKTNE